MFLLIVIALVAGLYVGGKLELKLRTVGGLNVLYTDSTGAVHTVF